MSWWPFRKKTAEASTPPVVEKLEARQVPDAHPASANAPEAISSTAIEEPFYHKPVVSFREFILHTNTAEFRVAKKFHDTYPNQDIDIAYKKESPHDSKGYYVVAVPNHSNHNFSRSDLKKIGFDLKTAQSFQRINATDQWIVPINNVEPKTKEEMKQLMHEKILAVLREKQSKHALHFDRMENIKNFTGHIQVHEDKDHTHFIVSNISSQVTPEEVWPEGITALATQVQKRSAIIIPEEAMHKALGIEHQHSTLR